MLKSVRHGSVLEHGTVYLHINGENLAKYINKYKSNKYSKVVDIHDENNSFIWNYYITTNYRVLVENDWLEDLQYMCEPTEHHEKRITVRFVCDRGVSHEFVRHRVFSFTQESTRYCNYSKDKFDNQITYIIPCWFDELKESTIEELRDVYGDKAETTNKWYSSDNAENNWIISMLDSEAVYSDLIDKGWKPQQARAVLPNSLKTELIMTWFESDWEHFFMLRDAAGAHPQAVELAKPLHEEFNRKYNNMSYRFDIIDINNNDKDSII